MSYLPPDFYLAAYGLADKAHRGQFRRDGKTQYFEHPLRVAIKILGATKDWELAAAAILHDSVEDRGISYSDLKAAGLPERVIQLVDALTKREGEDYFEDYLARIKPNGEALKIKLADILDNLADKPTPKQVKKYTRALDYLLF
jgi:(p)ppGpp synthase/HD superfamily hydrolase